MENCPKCNAEIEKDFELCWNCNYSFTEKRIIEVEEIPENQIKKINCIRCETKMVYSGQYKFHEGTRFGTLGNFFECFVDRQEFDIYICPKCGKAEFYTPLSE